MKTTTIFTIRNKWRLPGVLFLLPLMTCAQTLTTLHNFTGSDGSGPTAPLISSGQTLYGTTRSGGSGFGTIFAVNTDGIGFTNIYNFTNGNDGANPDAGLVLSCNTLYGTAANGGSGGTGTMFAINSNGTSFTTLHGFTAPFSVFTIPPFLPDPDGINPIAGLILAGNTLYGTAQGGGFLSGGYVGDGTVFAYSTGFTTVHTFAGGSDGGTPFAGVVLSGNALYGTTHDGGSGGFGTVFAVNTDGTGFTKLYNFTNGFDGANPYAGLILSGNTLYGTTEAGGSAYAAGAVFAVNTDGTGFTNLHTFTGGTDGSVPLGRLVLSGNTLYGTAWQGGSSGCGTIFAVNIDGTGFTTLHSFTGGDGANPWAGLILSSNTLYGTTGAGGSSGNGTVFALSLAPPSLGIASIGNQVVVYWPASASTYVLQSTTNLSSTNWVSVSNGVPIIGVTLPNSPSGGFFRLQQQ
jgi:uncharacterized repeat protein (TIGR03803 family)